MIVMWCLSSTAEAKYMPYKDPKQPLCVRVNDLMKRMTLEEKIGQMTQIERAVATNEAIKNDLIGSVLSGPGSVPSREATPETWVNMVNEFQKSSLSTRLGIPLIYGIDAVHGHNNVYKATIFPHNVGLGVTRDPVLVKKIGAATALEVRATGIQYAFAPCVAVCRDPRWGRCYESYSEDTEIVRLMTEIIPGLQGDITDGSEKGAPFVNGQQKIAACAKHYVGDGGTHLGIDEGDTILDSQKLFSIHMPAYNDSIIKGVATIMTSYSSWNGVKMHANRNLITGYLKNTLKFKGFVISDWEGIDKITNPQDANYTYSILAGINAGIDMVMVPFYYREFIDGLTYLVKNKFIPMSRVDDAVQRILRVKFTMGLFENPMADYSMTKYLGCQEHRDLAREAVRKTLVLLKNGKSSMQPLLPLPKKTSKILVAGSHADNIGYQCGGWTMGWQGRSGNVTAGTTILSAVKKTVYTNTQVIYNENPNQDFLKSNNFDFAIVVVGEPPYAQTSGDSSDLTILEPGPSTIRNVCGSVKCVVVLITGRPVVVQPLVDTIDALVAAWLPGTEGQGVTDVLFGDYGFTGTLACELVSILMTHCVGISPPQHYYGGYREVDGLCSVFEGRADKINMILDTTSTVLEGLRVLIVGGRNHHKHHGGGYYGVIHHPFVNKFNIELTKNSIVDKSLSVLHMGVKNMGKFLVFLMMVMWCWFSMAEAEYMLYKDPKQPPSVRVNDLMKRMTLEEKIGQMTQIERSVASNEAIKKDLIGSVLSGGGSVPSNQATPETWVNMVNDFQKGSLSTRLGIPLIYGIDAVHGHNNVYSSSEEDDEEIRYV
ncbi:hypothetical protein L1987_61063 [Smallanthus sonchifolius]|uniref:Uncharacterized protein n=1 Tax=Smallanthus sonchifolius TaxID=185202 RepID=A0ACB9DA11_9ASTR|nr:hypothetical protein L1987_61063 [Smallanthus sonchifolius]